MGPVLTLGLPMMSPTLAQLQWLRNVMVSLGHLRPMIQVAVSIHSYSGQYEVELEQSDLIRITEDYMTYDENVEKISAMSSARYWMLVAADDVIDINALKRFIDILDERDDDLVVLSEGRATPDFQNVKIGFLSTFVFSTEFSRSAIGLRAGSAGWYHTALFLHALQSRGRIGFFEQELVHEALPLGFIKAWTKRGNFIRYQVGLARLINWLLPNHPLRRSLECQAVGRWPFDILKAKMSGVELSLRERRFISFWFRRFLRESGLAGFCATAVGQMTAAVAARYSYRR